MKSLRIGFRPSLLQAAFWLITLLILFQADSGRADNSVVIEPKTVVRGAQNVSVGILIANEVRYHALVLPLEIRSLDSAFIANEFAFTVPTNGRLQRWVPAGASYGVKQVYAEKSTPSWPGAGAYCRPDDGGKVWDTSSSDVDFVSPDAVMYAAVGVDSFYIRPGGDGVPGASRPSLLMTFDVTTATGQFEIDTTCIRPGNHLTMLNEDSDPVHNLTFEKAVITVACDCSCIADPQCDGVRSDVLDVIACVNVAFRGFTSIADPLCPVNGFSAIRSDIDCSGGTDVLDVVSVVNVAFRGFTTAASGYCTDPCN